MARDTNNPNKYQRSDPLNPKKRGRPSKKAAENENGDGVFQVFDDKRGDALIIEQVTERFEGLKMYAEDIALGKLPALIISGAAGVGKTFTLMEILEKMHGEGKVVFKRTAGYVSTIEMYRILFEHRHEGNVVMFDDTDNVFYDDNSLNILKAACDSIPVRTVSYRTKSTVEVTEDDDLDNWDVEEQGLPSEFEFKGTCVFVTNIDFHAYLAGPRTRVTPHIEALLNRAKYLDMCLHAPRAVALWIQYMITTQHILEKPVHGLTREQAVEVLSFIVDNYKQIHKPSLRTAVKLAKDVKNHPDRWVMLAKMTELKPVVIK
ncbi:MAG TPA: hypothetical protein VFV84_02390 [Burkholderiales bacterium]|nr:hypothetical protein [Burkholderiales bacterium]